MDGTVFVFCFFLGFFLGRYSLINNVNIRKISETEKFNKRGFEICICD